MTYTDAVSDVLCASADIRASSCVNGICEHEIRMSSFSSECASSALQIMIVVAGANVLGIGLPSVSVKVSGITILCVYIS